ncbi:MAG: hypothetical protein ACQETV_04630 [Actinomycetota bacterium]
MSARRAGVAGRLGAVQRVREILERRALGDLARGEAEVDAAEQRLEQRRRDYANRADPPPVLTPLELRALQLQGLGAHELVEAATGDLEVAEHRRGELWQAWSHASIARKSVERLAERRAVEQAAAAEQAANRALDELILQRRHER